MDAFRDFLELSIACLSLHQYLFPIACSSIKCLTFMYFTSTDENRDKQLKALRKTSSVEYSVKLYNCFHNQQSRK